MYRTEVESCCYHRGRVVVKVVPLQGQSILATLVSASQPASAKSV